MAASSILSVEYKQYFDRTSFYRLTLQAVNKWRRIYQLHGDLGYNNQMEFIINATGGTLQMLQFYWQPFYNGTGSQVFALRRFTTISKLLTDKDLHGFNRMAKLPLRNLT